MGNLLIGLANGILKACANVLNMAVSVLPNSPFQMIDNSPVGEFLSGLAWVIPISQILAILELWVTAIGIYYLVQVILRWVKAIE